MINTSNQLDTFIPAVPEGNKSNLRSLGFISHPLFQEHKNEYIWLPANERTVAATLGITVPRFEELLDKFESKECEPSECEPSELPVSMIIEELLKRFENKECEPSEPPIYHSVFFDSGSHTSGTDVDTIPARSSSENSLNNDDKNLTMLSNNLNNADEQYLKNNSDNEAEPLAMLSHNLNNADVQPLKNNSDNNNDDEPLMSYMLFYDGSDAEQSRLSLIETYSTEQFIRKRQKEAGDERNNAVKILLAIDRLLEQQDPPNQGRNSSLTIAQNIDPMDAILAWCKREAPNFQKTQEQVSIVLEEQAVRSQIENEANKMTFHFQREKSTSKEKADMKAKIRTISAGVKAEFANQSLIERTIYKIVNVLASVFD